MRGTPWGINATGQGLATAGIGQKGGATLVIQTNQVDDGGSGELIELPRFASDPDEIIAWGFACTRERCMPITLTRAEAEPYLRALGE